MRKLPPNGRIIYRGPSHIPGANPTDRVVAIMTFKSRNKKTGNVATVWVFPETALGKSVEKGSLLKLLRSGEDQKSCFGCIHSSINQEDCYVLPQINKGPGRMIESIQRRLADNIEEAYIGFSLLRALLREHELTVRLCGYGDPTALPLGLLEALYLNAEFVLGYTHMWANLDPILISRYSKFLMASVESEQQRLFAHSRGFRTFRVKKKGEQKLKKEAYCPASSSISCKKCRLCRGNSLQANDIVIDEHGVFVKRRKVA